MENESKLNIAGGRGGPPNNTRRSLSGGGLVGGLRTHSGPNRVCLEHTESIGVCGSRFPQSGAEGGGRLRVATRARLDARANGRGTQRTANVSRLSPPAFARASRRHKTATCKTHRIRSTTKSTHRLCGRSLCFEEFPVWRVAHFLPGHQTLYFCGIPRPGDLKLPS